MKKKPEQPTFEEQLLRLEEIVQHLDVGDVPLAEMLTLYEEGMTLTQQCSQFLSETEQKVTTIQTS